MEGDFRIGDWLVQPLRDGIEPPQQSVQLEPKAMNLLVYLAEHQGEVIPKERLILTVWPDALVTDEALTNNIWKLRQAFGDDPRFSEGGLANGHPSYVTKEPPDGRARSSETPRRGGRGASHITQSENCGFSRMCLAAQRIDN